jgi:4-amino-4-deoxy-L-arabinose transferase-like glycosyltransferase
MATSLAATPQSRGRSPTIIHWSLIVGLILAFALRLYRLDAQSIWVDEGISLHLATSTLGEIVANRAVNIHPPLYFFLLKGWVALTGVNISTARFLSGMASLFQVAAIYAVTHRWLGRPAARIAALLTAVSPLSVIYAQEIRTYAILPLVYLALIDISGRLLPPPSGGNKLPKGIKPNHHHSRTWLLLGAVEVIGLHLHYTTFFLIAYVSGWSLLSLWRGNRWTDLRRWLTTQLLVGLASLPWLVTTLSNWSAVQAEATAGTATAQPPPLDYLLAQVWVFHLTGRAGALGRPSMRLASSVIFLALIVLLLFRLIYPNTRRTTARLVAHWLVPLSAALLVWVVRPYSHPRYISLFAPGLTILIAYLLCPDTKTQIPSQFKHWASRFTFLVSHILLIACLALTSLLSLASYFFDPTVAKDDIQGVAHYLEQEADTDDLILVPDGDWSLSFLYKGETPIEMPGVANEESMWAGLALWTAQRHRVFLMNYKHGFGGDQREIVPFALEAAGTLYGHQSFDNILIRRYQLDHPVRPPTMLPTDADFGSLRLTQAWVESEPPADTALTLALGWHLEEPVDERYGLTVRLLDIDGWPIAIHDGLLLDERVYPTDRWSAGQKTTTYHILPIPPGTPPLTYSLSIGLYEQTGDGVYPLDLLDDQGVPQGQSLSVATVLLDRPIGLIDRPYEPSSTPPLSQPVSLIDGLEFLGAEIDRSVLSPGGSLFVTLRWQANRSSLPDYRPRLALVQEGRELDAVESAPALGRYPTDLWQAQEKVVEHRRLVAPPAIAPGNADVVLTLGNRRLTLGQVDVDTEAHVFAPPIVAYPLDIHFGQVARLIGYDLPSQAVTAGWPVTITLYWQALEDAGGGDYTVFTHILASDGHLVGQHDSPPVKGVRRTLGWIPGEIIVDQHPMAFREPYEGPARIEIGMYNHISMERLQTQSGKDSVLLPEELTVLRP